jgi:hypothetical protein
VSQILAAAARPADQDSGELAQDRVLVRRPPEGGWRKIPDIPLGRYVASRLKRRTDKGISAAQTMRARIGKVRQNTTADGRERRSKWR